MLRYIAPVEIKVRPGRLSREALLLMLLTNPGRPVVGKPRK